MNYHKNILGTIGNTPMVKLNSIVEGIDALVLAKLETTNPGNSVKDRMALKMIEDAEADGRLKPGGTIVEGTSGNTGLGLAIAAIIKGYKCIFTTTDKQSKEKVDILKAFGAEVIVCPTNVEPDDPKSYYSVSDRLSKEIPNSFYPNQYDNPSNVLAHYEQTGPEIWEQTNGKITHFVVGVGTGGTISGTGKYLKEKNPDIKIMGIDTYGSVFKKYHETGEFDEKEIYPYITEGIGEDILPKCVNFDVIDHFEKVTDKNAAFFTRELTRREGIFAGNSAGAAISGLLQMKEKFTKDDVVVVLLHDHGSRYVGKMFNDDWMRDRGFLESSYTLREIVDGKTGTSLISVEANEKVKDAILLMQKNGISQLPVFEDNKLVGAVNEGLLLNKLLDNSAIKDVAVKDIMTAPFKLVDINTPVSKLNSDSENVFLTKDLIGDYFIITKQDLIQGMLR